MSTPSIRLHNVNQKPFLPSGDYILYWMTAYRRLNDNFALQRAVELANAHQKPLLIFEALGLGYPYSSPRFHRFIMDGMESNQKEAQARGISYVNYVEPAPGAARGLLHALSAPACAVVTDDFPTQAYQRLYKKASRGLSCAFEAVDGNGILPLAQPERTFTVAHSFRRHVHKVWQEKVPEFPLEDPLQSLQNRAPISPDAKTLSTWPSLGSAALNMPNEAHFQCLTPPVALRGGHKNALLHFRGFLRRHFQGYHFNAKHPDKAASSKMSPFLHFGHISSHEIFREITREEPSWDISQIQKDRVGRATGWWGLPENMEAYLDQLLTWREVGFVNAYAGDRGESLETLPAWAQKTLEDHKSDERSHLYSLAELEEGRTHDRMWNAAQQELLQTGLIHNHMRMIWGKKVLEWSSTPEEALEILFYLNDRYALDGRDPNSLTNIHWIFGKYDRAWGPERPVVGKVRYMSSENTRKKLRAENYLRTFGKRNQP